MDLGPALDTQDALRGGQSRHPGPVAADSGAAGAIRAPAGRSSRRALRTLLNSLGPGYLVAVGYMDPGNWVTDIAAGARFGFDLLAVILLANLVAILAQSLSVRLAIGSGLDLATACRRHYPRPVSLFLYLGCQIAIIACDLAEVIGTAIALNLLFGLPVLAGVGLSLVATLAILALQRAGRRWLEATIVLLILLVAFCLFTEIFLIRPPLGAVLAGLLPHVDLISNPEKLYLALGILGATVMPHNLYLHGALTLKAHALPKNATGQAGADGRKLLRFALGDLVSALSLAFFINAAILVVAAAAFNLNGRSDINDISQAYHMLSPLLGVSVASTLFGLALLAAGQSSTVTATLAGQVAMEGFLELRWPAWLVRLSTRAAAILPVLAVMSWFGSGALTDVLVFSQVILSLQLPFALIPLIHLTGKRGLMGNMASGPLLWALSAVIAVCLIALNLMVIRALMGS